MSEINTTQSYKVTDLDLHATGPGTLAGRYLRMFWHPICLSTEVEAGRSRREQIMSEFVTLYRGQSGQLHAVADRCPHRGVRIARKREIQQSTILLHDLRPLWQCL